MKKGNRFVRWYWKNVLFGRWFIRIPLSIVGIPYVTILVDEVNRRYKENPKKATKELIEFRRYLEVGE